MLKNNILISISVVGFISSAQIIIFHFYEIFYLSISAILFVVGMALAFYIMRGNPASNLNIIFSGILAGVFVIPTTALFLARVGIFIGIIISLAICVFSPFLSGYIANGSIISSWKFGITAITYSFIYFISYFISSYFITLVAWLGSCAFLDYGDGSCSTGAGLMLYGPCGYIFISAPIIGICIAYFIKLGFRARNESQAVSN